ncbi:MAG: Flp family type IVb pilin [Phyllobacteriaceae bacterium]|nr:Flp family type IVb pilin [Phyllobacteriaceae bacterium]
MCAKSPWAAFLRDGRGATSIEYALLIGLIFLAIVTSVGSTGSGLTAKWIGVADTASANLYNGQ